MRSLLVQSMRLFRESFFSSFFIGKHPPTDGKDHYKRAEQYDYGSAGQISPCGDKKSAKTADNTKECRE